MFTLVCSALGTCRMQVTSVQSLDKACACRLACASSDPSIAWLSPFLLLTGLTAVPSAQTGTQSCCWRHTNTATVMKTTTRQGRFPAATAGWIRVIQLQLQPGCQRPAGRSVALLTCGSG
jgi:hypothetical protein